MDPNAALRMWRKVKSSQRRQFASAIRGWIAAGGFEPDWTEQERALILFGRTKPATKRGNPMTTKRKPAQKKKVARKRNPPKRFTVTAYSGSTVLGKQTFASQKKAESVAKRLVSSGKASKCSVED